jgi:hypothetical protein
MCERCCRAEWIYDDSQRAGYREADCSRASSHVKDYQGGNEDHCNETCRGSHPKKGRRGGVEIDKRWCSPEGLVKTL